MLNKNMMVKDEGSKEIIVEVGLMVIAVALLQVYKEAVTDLIKNLCKQLEVNINKLYKF